MEIAAKKVNDEAKETTAKLMGNSDKFILYCIDCVLNYDPRVRKTGEIYQKVDDYDEAAEFRVTKDVSIHFANCILQ